MLYCGIKNGELRLITAGSNVGKSLVSMGALPGAVEDKLKDLKTMSLELKIKSKHLGEEARIIRFEEQKLKKQLRWYANRQALPPGMDSQYKSIHNHRVWDVRNENRATFLARAFIEGRPYSSVERSIKNHSNFNAYIYPRLFDMAAKYGNFKVYKTWNGGTRRMEYEKARADVLKQQIKEWLET